MARKLSFRWIKAGAVGAAMALSSTLPAQAQFTCGAHDELVAKLAVGFQEKRIGYGVFGHSALIEAYVSTSGTWTMLITDVKGQSCIVAADDGWESTLAVIAADRGG